MARPTLDDARASLAEANWIGTRGPTGQRGGQFDAVRSADVPSHQSGGPGHVSLASDKPLRVHCVFVSHADSDHWRARVLGWPDFVAEGCTAEEAVAAAGRTHDLEIETRRSLEHLLSAMKAEKRHGENMAIVLQLDAPATADN